MLMSKKIYLKPFAVADQNFKSRYPHSLEDFPIFVRFYSGNLRKLDTTQPFAFYEVLGLRRDAKQSEVKAAYFKLAKVYHPDVCPDDDAREIFDKITEAYTTLIDLTQRYFYDQHGVACQELKKRGSNSTIFDWVPKYSIYEETRPDGESTQVEDWFKAQGHHGFNDERISIRQRMKNAYVEFRYGLAYYDFPWEWKKFAAGVTVLVISCYICIETLNYGFKNVSYRKPTPIYLKWENDDIYDILWYVGARKNKGDNSGRGLTFPTNRKGIKPKSEMAIGGMHHMAKRSSQKSEYSHTIYSNTRSRTKKKNLERHKLRKQADDTKKLKIKKSVKKKQTDGFSL